MLGDKWEFNENVFTMFVRTSSNSDNIENVNSLREEIMQDISYQTRQLRLNKHDSSIVPFAIRRL